MLVEPIKCSSEFTSEECKINTGISCAGLFPGEAVVYPSALGEGDVFRIGRKSTPGPLSTTVGPSLVTRVTSNTILVTYHTIAGADLEIVQPGLGRLHESFGGDTPACSYAPECSPTVF